ncbi:MAG: 30S ribosomal protein S8e [Candidatus Pacearchaeota archaeon]|nr:30S ribosomal protein S8e [Candidatus Pacearchaeota archaeon]
MRKITGGKYKKARKKKLREKKSQPREVILGEEKKKKIRLHGGKIRIVLLRTNKANVFDPKTKECKVVKIKNVLEVPSNPVAARKNVLVKGAIIETEIGKARITNRPSRESSVQAVLI